MLFLLDHIHSQYMYNFQKVRFPSVLDLSCFYNTPCSLRFLLTKFENLVALNSFSRTAQHVKWQIATKTVQCCWAVQGCNGFLILAFSPFYWCPVYFLVVNFIQTVLYDISSGFELFAMDRVLSMPN